jgi:anti-sigma-K factor RskA
VDTQAYISSGVIEAYVMGLASEEEIQILECVQKHNAEVKQAVLGAQIAIEGFVTREAVTPPVHLKNNIWAAIQAEDAKSETDSAPIIELFKDNVKTDSQLEIEAERSPEIPVVNPVGKQFEIKNYKNYAVAASVALIVGVGASISLFQDKTKLQDQIALLEQKNREDNINYSQLLEKWNTSSNPDMKTVILAGLDNHPGTKAIVYIDKATKQTYLSVENLPACPAGHAYQLWAIVGGKPVDGGMYQESKDSMQKMYIIENAQAFAITLEKEGGSAVPTMENMYVMGEV